MTRTEGVQMNLPGIDPDPAPETIEQAERFLRLRVKTSFDWHEDHDLMKIKIACDNLDGDKGAYSDQAELPLDDRAYRERKIITLAKNAHEFMKKRKE